MKTVQALFLMMFWLTATGIGSAEALMPLMPAKPVASQTVAFQAAGRDIAAVFSRLERPGEFALTITYWGPLTQEGPVNLWISLNGETREFITLHELANRHQTITLLSFHPIDPKADGPARLPLAPWERVDPGFFRNACYEPELGENHLEFIFFAHGRWDGNPEQHNANYTCSF